ncbi:nucleoside phosphatase family protein [Striga asiatica]|uniref:Nucleoside phosphatase family protein n=1 Tax=Striga asiatica TaxID=4170 RepID=A0A5A7QQX3_STRAF|nr:nucleoside phosphatase family protein [Striga asiatica]
MVHLTCVAHRCTPLLKIILHWICKQSTQLSAYSLSGYGLNDAFDKSVAHLENLPHINNADLLTGKTEIEHPCLHTGYREQNSCSQCSSVRLKDGNSPTEGKSLNEKGKKPGVARNGMNVLRSQKSPLIYLNGQILSQDSIVSYSHRAYVPLFRHNSGATNSVLNIPSPFRFQRWSPINAEMEDLNGDDAHSNPMTESTHFNKGVRKKRGPKQHAGDKKINISFDCHLKPNEPTKEICDGFTSYVGVLARTKVSILANNWEKDVPQKIKDQICETLLETFEMPNDKKTERKMV